MELAMAGGAWREAINRLLTSKERCGDLEKIRHRGGTCVNA